MKLLIRLIQLLFAGTFVFSGMAKCIDPAGTAIKLGEYLQYFGLGMFEEFTMGLAWLLCLVEFFCGINLLIGHARITSLTLSSLMMAVFTPLTLWLALHEDAIQDCGCFGDAVHLSNMATFVKNVVLDVMLVMLWIYRSKTYTLGGRTIYTLYKYCAILLMGLLCYLGSTSEPLIDFRPYTPGTDLRRAVLGDGERQDELHPYYTCIYERAGERQEFDIDQLPNEEDGWEFVETIEHQPETATGTAVADRVEAIDFFARTADETIYTESLLEASGYTFLLLSHSLDKASQHDIDRIEKLLEYSEDNDYAFYALTGPDRSQYQRWCEDTGAEYTFLFTDATIVETICRSNPCVMLLRDGVICWKKPLAELDTEALTSAKLNEQSYGEIEEIAPLSRFLALIVLLFGPILLYLLVKNTKKR